VSSGSPLETEALEAFRTAQKITRGVRRLLATAGYSSVCELVLPNGRRADVVGMSGSGGILIVEVKSSAADFRADSKWPEYLSYCDQFYFALAPDGPVDLIPADVGLILADPYSGEFVRNAPHNPMVGARRRPILLAFARHAANQLHALQDNQFKGAYSL
jgi:hypothetical protein